MLTSEPPPLAMPAVIQLPPVRVLIEEVETFLALYPDAHRTVNHDARQVVARQQQIARPPPRLRERPSPYSQRHVRRFSAAGENSIPVPNFALTSPHPLPTRKGAKHLADRSETDLGEDLHAAVTSLIRDIERRNSSDRRIEIDLAFRSQTRPRSPASFIAYLTGHSNPNSPRHAEARAHLQASCFSSSHRIYESKTPIPNSPRRCSAFACVSAPDELPNNKLIFPIDWSHTGLDRTPVWVPATDRVVYFQSTEPSEEDIGVPLFVIEKFPQGMLGGERDVFRELRQKNEGIQEIRLVLALANADRSRERDWGLKLFTPFDITLSQLLPETNPVASPGRRAPNVI
ncbi:hypothetical protein NLJ89_g9 [Agrocybe chaxingu]|uniref:Uncharacterized protein n=1 Tax=Agrocybe chaxingu TaxID=84603 RepID=A0A9W8N2Q0_9AGAR|nr:hypothetical protein NLJ89_g9 [Agrocybe chaxingu]